MGDLFYFLVFRELLFLIFLVMLEELIFGGELRKMIFL